MKINGLVRSIILIFLIVTGKQDESVALCKSFTDTIPLFTDMYSYDDIEMVEYDILTIWEQNGTTVASVKRQFWITSKWESTDSISIDYKLKDLDLLDTIIRERSGSLKLYNDVFEDKPDFSNLANFESGHFACTSNFSELWPQIYLGTEECLQIDSVSLDMEEKFGRAVKTGVGDFDGDMLYDFQVSLIEGIGLNEYEFLGFMYNSVKMVGYVTSTDTIGVVSNFASIVSNTTSNEQSEKITIFPNPTQKTLRITPYDSSLKITLTDHIAKQYDYEISADGEIDVSLLPNGVYYIHMRDSTHKSPTVKRFIKI